MMPLRVTRNDKIADGIHLLEFRDAGGKPLPEFSAGAHIAIRVPNGAAAQIFAVQRPGRARPLSGRGQARGQWPRRLQQPDRQREGRRRVDGDARRSTISSLPQRAQDFLFIAGGIGITPIMAMIRQVQAEGKRFRLFYCTRSPETTAFLDELSAPEFKDKVTIHYDQGDPSRSLDLRPILAERKNREHLYCCGPRPLMEAVRAHDRPLVVGRRAFRGVQRGRDAQADRQAVQGEAGALRRGHRGADRPRPFSKPCASTASTCRVPAKPAPAAPAAPSCWPGEADHRDLVLAEHERADNIMICVSRARSDEITHRSLARSVTRWIVRK